MKLDRCWKNSNCINNIGSYICECKKGYTFTKNSCISMILIRLSIHLSIWLMNFINFSKEIDNSLNKIKQNLKKHLNKRLSIEASFNKSKGIY